MDRPGAHVASARLPVGRLRIVEGAKTFPRVRREVERGGDNRWHAEPTSQRASHDLLRGGSLRTKGVRETTDYERSDGEGRAPKAYQTNWKDAGSDDERDALLTCPQGGCTPTEPGVHSWPETCRSEFGSLAL